MRAAFLRFAAIGVLATLVHVVVFTLCVELIAIPPVAASIPAFCLALLVSYFANRRWTFRGPGFHHLLLPKFAAVQITGLGLNAGITYLVVNLLHLWYGIALAICVAVVPLITFLLHRSWTFGAQVKS